MDIITIYTTPYCPYCHELKNFLDSYNIKYTEIDVSQDQKAAEELIKKTGQLGVPVTDIDGEIIIGFDVPKLKEKLNIK